MRASRAIALSMLLVASTVAPGVGLGQTATETATPAETQTEWQTTLAGSPDRAGVDVRDVSGEITVEFATDGAPGGGYQPLARETFDASSLSRGFIVLQNDAYENITVKATLADGATGEPEIVDGSEIPITASQKEVGAAFDTDLTCDTAERLHGIVSPFEPQPVECSSLPGTTNVNTTGTDAEQIKLDIYQSAQNQRASSEIYQTTLDNKLEDTETQARIVGKNAYIRALNNGSSEAAAKTAAKQAVADYYAVMQANLVKKWNLQAANAEHLNETAASESGVPVNYPLQANLTHVPTDGNPNYDHRLIDRAADASTESVTLVNGTSMTSSEYMFQPELYATDSDYTNKHDGEKLYVGITTGMYNKSIYAEYGYANFWGFKTAAPTENHEPADTVRFEPYEKKWSEIESQNDAVQSDMDTLVSNTYDEYQAGEINNSDLVDPYVFSQEFSPGDEYQGWAAAQLTMLGTNSPEAMDSIGRFNVSAESGEYTGVLMSQTNPASGQFETNTTYDPANISGTQYVVTDSQIYELTTPFEIRSIETTDGETRQNVTIEKTTYETADINTTQLQQTYENLRYLREQYEAREQALGGGGGGGFFGGGSIDRTVALLALAALAGAALLGKS